jgi:hypothetical protein
MYAYKQAFNIIAYAFNRQFGKVILYEMIKNFLAYNTNNIKYLCGYLLLRHAVS